MNLRLSHPRETKISGFLAEVVDARPVGCCHVAQIDNRSSIALHQATETRLTGIGDIM
jgi:hypothetical protein